LNLVALDQPASTTRDLPIPQGMLWGAASVTENVVVEGTLKPGQRHTYSRRVFYVDEDSWQIVVADNYDKDGQLWRSVNQTTRHWYRVMPLEHSSPFALSVAASAAESKSAPLAGLPAFDFASLRPNGHDSTASFVTHSANSLEENIIASTMITGIRLTISSCKLNNHCQNDT
jgi:Protein of unknown function (DUF1329)